MTDSEKLDLILEQVSNLGDKVAKFEKTTNDRFDVIELRQNHTSKKLDDLQLDVKIAERDIRRDIHTLKDEMETVVEVLKLNELIPR